MDYYYFFPVAVGLGGLMTIFLNERWHQLHDRVHLALLLCSVIAIYVTLRAIVVGTGDYAYIVLDNIETLAGLLLCPLFFLYIRCTAYDPKWRKWYGWLFAPGIILAVAGTTLSLLVGWDRILGERGWDYHGFVPNPESLVEKLYLLINIQVFNMTLEGMAVMLIAMSIYYLVRYHKRTSDFYANLEDSSFSHLNYFLFTGLLFFMTTFLITFLIRKVILLDKGILLCISLWFSFLLSVMFYCAFKIRLTKQQEEALEDSANYLLEESNVTSDGVLAQRIAEWETRKDKPFCKEGITLADLAREFGVSRRSLSEYINTQKGINFNAWINTLRVEEAKRLLRISSELKIGYISDICGFGTQSTFSKTFRQIEGRTPQSYRDSQGVS